MFSQALKREGEGHGAGLFVDYGHFLCACGEYSDAITNLSKAVEAEKENPTSVNYYGQMECHTVDDQLKKEITVNGGLEIPSIIFAQYLMLDCYSKTKKSKNITSTLHDMGHVCDALKDPISYRLLGYSLLKQKELDRASGAFKCAVDLDPKNKLAREQLSKCKKSK